MNELPKRRHGKRPIRFLLRILISVLTAPWRIFVATKHSLTSASVTLMLIMLMAFNIIWGYPWTGMLAACFALLMVGLLANWLTRAKLSVGCNLPRSVPAGQSFRVTAHLTSTNRLPALDTLVGWATLPKRPPKKSKQTPPVVETSEPEFYPLLRAGEPAEYVSLVKFDRRGLQSLPKLMVQSAFPFYLFRSTSLIDVKTQIAVTPRPLAGQDELDARRVLFSIGDWARRLLMGDASEYAGSREYTTGMPVRRWDFASWARLGKPIVREFKSPSVRSMNLIVDTSDLSSNEHVQSVRDLDESFEYLMSMSVSVLNLLSTSSATVAMFLSDECVDPVDNSVIRSTPGSLNLVGEIRCGDRSSQLMRLAMSQPIDSKTADDNIRQAIERIGREPTLLLTRRKESEFAYLSGNVSVMAVGPESTSAQTNAASPGGNITKPSRESVAQHSQEQNIDHEAVS
ncbi:DUF58 domain-containing protein [Planctomycetes bacterium K23_9]|uniref:Uncharacterized protein n=1 Tax=Stieleria marina TaxID=1930275 RepID=A0A517NSP3_9BACT|nr:hypothetical protein K239x_20840 [Planctomycetes bacterium K23_9]